MKNIREQEYTAEYNELAVESDITYLWTVERWLYLAIQPLEFCLRTRKRFAHHN